MTDDERFRSQHVRVSRLGDELGAVALRTRAPPHLVPAGIAMALDDLARFRTLDDHARTVCERIRNPGAFAAVRATLQHLVEVGDLVSSRSLLDTCSRSLASDDAPARIRSIAFPTREREQQLARAIASYARNASDHGTACEIVVTDASTTADARARCRARLDALGRELDLSIAYAGAMEIERYAAVVAQESGVALDVVRFALLDTEGIGRTIGANRNVLLLHHVGEAFLSADDDTEARLAASPEMEGGICFSSQAREEAWFFADRAAAVAAAPAWDGGLVALHEHLLGRRFSSIVRDAVAEGDSVDVDEPTSAMMRDIADGSGRVVLSFTGLYGDSGMGDAQSLALGISTPTGQRATRSADAYRVATTSREILKMVAQTTIAPPSGSCMTTSVAFDHRDLLPPFCPVGVEDRLFGLTLSKLSGRYSAFVPFAIFHAASAGRTYAPIVARHVAFNDLVEPHIAAFPFEASVGDAASRLEALGDSLVALGAASAGDYESYQRDRILSADENAAARLSALLALHTAAPPYWRADVEARLAHIRARADDDAYAVPIDLLEGRTREEACALGQRLVGKLGELLRAWPAIVDAAKRLRARNVRIATM